MSKKVVEVVVVVAFNILSKFINFTCCNGEFYYINFEVMSVSYYYCTTVIFGDG